jgi:hypothetical protein
MPPRCDALGARSAIDAHNVAPRYFSEDAIPRQVRLGQYNLIGLGLDPAGDRLFFGKVAAAKNRLLILFASG